MEHTSIERTGDQPAKILDLKDEVCPYTYVKSKLALEDLSAGSVLEIHLGNSESASNVPRSAELEGHKVIKVEKAGPGHWIIQVSKGDT